MNNLGEIPMLQIPNSNANEQVSDWKVVGTFGKILLDYL